MPHHLLDGTAKGDSPLKDPVPCPVCGHPAGDPVLVRRNVPVHQNLVVDTPAAARALRGGTLTLCACGDCGFVYNADFDPSLLQYGAAYDNTQTCSAAFQQHVTSRAEHLVRTRGVRGATIVEIGCGKGTFLSALAALDAGNRGVGFDPTYVGPDASADGRLRFERRFYDETCGTADADVIVCRHVIEHVPQPVQLLRTIRQTLRRPDVQLFFETPCVEWIFTNDCVWDLFYEHCSYFSPSSLARAFAEAGFDVDTVTHVFGGQYLWAEATPEFVGGPLPVASHRIADLAKRYASREKEVVSELRARIDELSRRGPIAIWGAAAKGVTLANLVDPDATLVACIVDINPNKQGKYLPGSAHPIVAPQDMAALGVRTALVTNPNYFEESSRIVRDADLRVELVDLMHSHADTD